MKLLVISCDKNEDLFYPFYHCIEKYWPEHPEVICSTETLQNPYYKTICKNLPLNKYSRRIQETLKEIDDDKVIITIDDIFIRRRPDVEQFDYLCSFLKDNVAAINFQQPFSNDNIPINEYISKRSANGLYKTSMMFQLWDRKKAIEVFDCDASPWDFEMLNNHKGYDYLIANKYPIDWGRPITGGKWAVYRGKWSRECKNFLDKEGIEIDYSRRGFCE